jgi:protein tyrosine phosphatase (PTP) superfamily phosphohydrolase (DUF442 family)
MDDSALASLYNYRRVSDRIGASGMPTEAQLGDIARAGFEVVINLDQLDSRHALPDERQTVAALGLIYEQIPVVWDNPGHAQVVQFLDALDRYADKRVFVHCVANYRASVFIALYRILRLGWPPAEALADMMTVWQPNPTWQAFIASELAQ